MLCLDHDLVLYEDSLHNLVLLNKTIFANVLDSKELLILTASVKSGKVDLSEGARSDYMLTLECR